MSDLLKEIEAYESLKSDLELSAMGKWVVIKGQKVVDTYDSFDSAAQDAVKKFGRGPYLIRQVGASPITLPTSVMYRFA